MTKQSSVADQLKLAIEQLFTDVEKLGFYSEFERRLEALRLHRSLSGRPAADALLLQISRNPSWQIRALQCILLKLAIEADARICQMETA